MSIFENAIYLDDVSKDQYVNYIGNGYRSICYTLNHDKQGTIILLGYDKQDNPKTFIIPWNSYIKYVVKFKTEELDIYDRYVTKKEFKNIFERKKYIENCPGLTIVECLRPEQEFTQFMFDNEVFEDGFNTQPLRIHYFDIETEISEQFEKPADARNRINMMTIYDNFTEKFYTWSLQHAEINFTEEPLKDYPKDKFVFFEFNNNEEKMLLHFLNWYENNYPDVNCNWNGKNYDIPYLTRRIENVLGKEDAKRLSPIHKYFIKDVNHDNERSDKSAEIEVNIDGLFIADCLVLYRDKFQISKPDGGFTLDNIGEVEGCGHKIKYDGTLKDLYLNDYQKFYEYNVRDVDLVKRIEDKCKMVALSRTITSFGLCSYMTIYSSISYLIGSVIAFAKTKMNRTMCSYIKEKINIKGFEGAFVFPTQQGLYKDGIACIDFASLYPSNIRSINASPETYVGKVLIQYKSDDGVLLPINETDELFFNIFDDNIAKASNVVGFILKLANGQRKAIELDKLREWINKKGIYTTNNTIFLKHEIKWGIIPKWCEYFYNQRKATKKKMLALFHELTDNGSKLSENEKIQKEKNEQNLNSRQMAFKAMINSIYGMMGTGFSPIVNLDIAQTITRQGRFCNTNASNFILKEFQKRYNENFKGYNISLLDEGDPRESNIARKDVIAIGGDTDSVVFKSILFINKNFKKFKIQIGELYQSYLDKNYPVIIRDSGHEVIDVSNDNIETLTLGNKYTKVLKLSRHKTLKELIEITVNTGNSIIVTTDHVCMKFNRDHFFENTNAKNLSVGDEVSIYNENENKEILGYITFIKNIGHTDNYVYDLKVEDSIHSFYANNILIHNSQFINLEPLTYYMRKNYNLDQKIRNWPDDKQWELWNTMNEFVENEVNGYVRSLITNTCKTTQANVLTYELEYLADAGIYESKKHYFIRKLFEEGSKVDKIKVTGIALKKNETDKSIKNFLEEIYKGAVINGWNINDYANYIYDLYQKFKKMNIDQISFWKGYGTARESIGFLKMAVGTTMISKACTYHNQLIEKMGLGKKYDQLRVGDKCRLVYIKPNNKYGINCLAYKPGQWPKEFNKFFEIDYEIMFDKIILDQLKRFREACKFEDIDPKKQVVQDIFDL